MYLGTSLALIAIGLIFALAVEDFVDFVDTRMVGWILVIVGVIGAILELAVFRPRRTTHGGTTEREVVRDRERY